MPVAEDIVNQALDILKRPRIVSFYDGSPEAIMAIDIYSQSRDEALISQAWPFARSQGSLTTAGVAAPAPWTNEFIYPGNSIKLLLVAPISLPVWPVPVRWLELIDTRISAPQRAIVCNFSPAYAVWTTRVTDPTAFPADFTEVFVQILVQKFADRLRQGQGDDSGRSGK